MKDEWGNLEFWVAYWTKGRFSLVARARADGIMLVKVGVYKEPVFVRTKRKGSVGRGGRGT